MNKILVLLLIIGLVFSFYTNNATSNEKSDFSFDSNCIKTKHSFIGNDSKLQFTDDSIDCFDALEKVDVEYVNTDTLYQTQHFATYYFYNLRENMGYNYAGSCSYVGIAMMLSYYDTYWDDTIINDDFDENGYRTEEDIMESSYYELKLSKFNQSPGIETDMYATINERLWVELFEEEEFTVDRYYEFVGNNNSNYFHFHLIKKILTDELYALRISEDKEPFGLGAEGREDLIEDYLNVSGAKLTYETVTTDVENYIISNVSRGIPVMVAVDLADQKTGHVLVVYDYDATTGKLYANMGWMDEYDESGELVTYTHVDLSSINYTRIKNATTFTPTDSHSHAYNYVYWDGSTYCSCYFPCHNAHQHTYVSVNDNYHTYSCNCATEETPNINHSLYVDDISDTEHTFKCTECDYSVTSEHDMTIPVPLAGAQHGCKCNECDYVDESTLEAHSYNSFMYVSDTAHRSTCDGCGAWKETTSPHTFTVPDRLGRMTCIGCGYTKIKGSDFGNVILSITKVSANGSYILPDGTIMLVDEDIEAYLNGTLVFYDKDNLPQTQ